MIAIQVVVQVEFEANVIKKNTSVVTVFLRFFF